MIWAPPHEEEVVGEDSSLLAVATADQEVCCGCVLYQELGVSDRGMALLHESAAYQGYL
jgi:hypothetical protein